MANNIQPDSVQKDKEPNIVRGISFVAVIIGTILVSLYMKNQNKNMKIEKDDEIKKVKMELDSLKKTYSQYDSLAAGHWILFVPKEHFHGMKGSRYDTLVTCDIFLHNQIKDCVKNVPKPGNQSDK